MAFKTRSVWRKITALSPTALMLFNVNYFMYVHRFCLETYLLLDGLPSQDDNSHLAACEIGYFVINYQLNKKWLSLKLRIYITLLVVKTNL